MAAADPPIRAVIGLGNPGDRYDRTRHNAGFWFADELFRRHGVSRASRKFHGEHARLTLEGRDVHVLKPLTYMNHSGRAVRALVDFYRLEPGSLLVVHDEIDLPPGVVRLKCGGGHGGHNGLRDTVKALDSREFARLRLGVGHPGSADAVVPYVLARAAREEQSAIEHAIDRAAEVLPWLLAGDWDRAQQRLHTAG